MKGFNSLISRMREKKLIRNVQFKNEQLRKYINDYDINDLLGLDKLLLENEQLRNGYYINDLLELNKLLQSGELKWLGNAVFDILERVGVDKFFLNVVDKDFTHLDLKDIDLSTVDFTNVRIYETHLENTRARLDFGKINFVWGMKFFLTCEGRFIRGCYALNNYVIDDYNYTIGDINIKYLELVGVNVVSSFDEIDDTKNTKIEENVCKKRSLVK